MREGISGWRTLVVRMARSRGLLAFVLAPLGGAVRWARTGVPEAGAGAGVQALRWCPSRSPTWVARNTFSARQVRPTQ